MHMRIDFSIDCMQSSLTSEMRNMSFEHVDHFHHRHFPDMRHDFQTNHPQDFLKSVAADMAAEALNPAFGVNYTAHHKHPIWDAKMECVDDHHEYKSRRKLWRKKDHRVMPKHFYIDDWHRSDYDRGEFASQ